LWRHHDSALQAAALVLAMSRSWISDREPFHHDLHFRQIIQLTDLIHNFCYHARKSIEMAEEFRPGTLDAAKKQKIHYQITSLELDDTEKTVIQFTEQPFWWVICRLIHSREALVTETSETVVAHERTGRTRTILRPVAFAFRSDLDQPDQLHYVHTESLVSAFLYEVSRMIEEATETHVHGDDKT